MADIKGYYTLNPDDENTTKTIETNQNIPAYKKAKKNASKIIETGVNMEVEKFENRGNGLRIFLKIAIASCLGFLFILIWKKMFV